MIQSKTVKYPLTFIGTILINVLIFTAIQYMVVNRQMRLAETTNFDLASFIRMQEQSRDVRSRRDPEAPKKPQADTQRDLARLASAAKSGGIGGLAVNMPNIDINIDVSGGIQIARELTPLVRIPPEYPYAAQTNGIEGYVMLMFTVTETGSVKDPQVVASSPEGVFERAAIRSILRWKYQPQFAGDEPISVVARTRITFKMLE